MSTHMNGISVVSSHAILPLAAREQDGPGEKGVTAQGQHRLGVAPSIEAAAGPARRSRGGTGSSPGRARAPCPRCTGRPRRPRARRAGGRQPSRCLGHEAVPHPAHRLDRLGVELCRSRRTATSTTLLPGSKSRPQTSCRSSSLRHTSPCRRIRWASRVNSRSGRTCSRSFTRTRRRSRSSRTRPGLEEPLGRHRWRTGAVRRCGGCSPAARRGGTASPRSPRRPVPRSHPGRHVPDPAQHDDGWRARHALDCVEDLEPVHPGHDQIQHHERRPGRRKKVDSSRPVRGLRHVVSLSDQRTCQERPQARFVVHNKDRTHTSPRARGASSPVIPLAPGARAHDLLCQAPGNRHVRLLRHLLRSTDARQTGKRFHLV